MISFQTLVDYGLSPFAFSCCSHHVLSSSSAPGLHCIWHYVFRLLHSIQTALEAPGENVA